MAAADYLRAAAAEVRKAAQDLHDQVRSTQAEYDHHRRDLEGAISMHEIEIRTKEAGVAAMGDPADVKGMRLQIAALQKMTGDRKKELDASRANVDRQVSGKLAFASQLEGLASQLDGLVGRPEAG